MEGVQKNPYTARSYIMDDSGVIGGICDPNGAYNDEFDVCEIDG